MSSCLTTAMLLKQNPSSLMVTSKTPHKSQQCWLNHSCRSAALPTVFLTVVEFYQWITLQFASVDSSFSEHFQFCSLWLHERHWCSSAGAASSFVCHSSSPSSLLWWTVRVCPTESFIVFKLLHHHITTCYSICFRGSLLITSGRSSGS